MSKSSFFDESKPYGRVKEFVNLPCVRQVIREFRVLISAFSDLLTLKIYVKFGQNQKKKKEGEVTIQLTKTINFPHGMGKLYNNKRNDNEVPEKIRNFNNNNNKKIKMVLTVTRSK